LISKPTLPPNNKTKEKEKENLKDAALIAYTISKQSPQGLL
jgi:hypothetical protein